jgi:GMP synthase-like glutamine amidotransferase
LRRGATAAIIAPMPPRLLVLQHESDSPPGLLGERFAARGAAVTVLDAERGCRLPDDAAGCDGLVLLGGAMSAYDDARCPHFPALLDLVRERARAGRPVLGVGLGAQLVARALGAKVWLGTTPQFGFVDLEAMPAAVGDLVAGGAVPGLPVMQRGEDQMDLPEGSELLLRCERGRVQAFRWGRAVYAFQCRLEATAESIRAWGAARARAKNNPAVSVRLGAEIVRHHARAARFGREAADGWSGLVEQVAG